MARPHAKALPVLLSIVLAFSALPAPAFAQMTSDAHSVTSDVGDQNQKLERLAAEYVNALREKGEPIGSASVRSAYRACVASLAEHLSSVGADLADDADFSNDLVSAMTREAKT